MKKNLFLFSVVSAVVLSLPVSAALAEGFRAPEMKFYEMRKHGTVEVLERQVLAFDQADENGGTVAVGDVNGDSFDEIIVGAGPGSRPVVRVYNAAGTRLSEFLAYPEGVVSGVQVASGDLNNDGTDEIVVGTGRGGGPQIRVFDINGNTKFTPGFFAFDQGFRGGVNVAVGNVNGKGGDEIIAGAGAGGGPHVRVFNKYGKFIGVDFFPFSLNDKGGVSVAAANVDGGKEDEIVMAIHSFGEPWIKVYKADANRTIVGQFTAYDKSFHGGVNVAAADVDRDGVDEVITSTRQSGGPHIRIFEGHGQLVDPGWLAYESNFTGGVSVAAGNIDGDAKKEVITIPQKKIVQGRTDLYKYIEVDISEQKLRAYRNGVLENEFLVSTGTTKYPTPLGTTQIYSKLPVHDYEWSYGPNHPDNYSLQNVVNNLRFGSHFYFHYAYWHNNFGHRMSHGCVNINLQNSNWLYGWANVGDTVIIQP